MLVLVLILHRGAGVKTLVAVDLPNQYGTSLEGCKLTPEFSESYQLFKCLSIVPYECCFDSNLISLLLLWLMECVTRAAFLKNEE